MSKVAVWGAVAALVVIALSGLLLAGEMHYRNCLAKEDLQAKYSSEVEETFGNFSNDSGPSGDECSRWPL